NRVRDAGPPAGVREPQGRRGDGREFARRPRRRLVGGLVEFLLLAPRRAQLGLVALLVALAALAWWWTVRAMADMSASPGTNLGALGWFMGSWVVMMAAMMLPAVSPTVALYARMTKQPSLARPTVFTGGYLIVWGAAGIVAYALYALGRDAFGG